MKVPKKFEFMALSARTWLDELYKDSSYPRSPQQLKDDFAKAMRWLGIRSFSDIRQEHYELWSAGFVCYLAEGKAPSASLKRQFEAYSQWAKEDPPPFIALDDDVRGVFGRLLAFDTAIAPQSHAPQGFGTTLLRWSIPCSRDCFSHLAFQIQLANRDEASRLTARCNLKPVDAARASGANSGP